MSKTQTCTECAKELNKKEVCTCANCGKTLCAKHTYSYVDEANHAITKNSPEVCRKCYLKLYGR
jgi:hypothetical protein